MYARGTEWMLRCAALLALLLLCLPARAQWDARTPGRLAAFTSGPAAVSLVASLQSLSVSALPGTVPVSGIPIGTDSDLRVKTAWTIRANCTTLRLSGYADRLTAFPHDPSAAAAAAAAAGQFSGRAALSPNETGWTDIVQPVGPSNYPGSRTDSIGFGNDGGDNSSSDIPASPVFILVQAL